MIHQLHDRLGALQRAVWGTEPESQSGWRGRSVRLARLAFAVARDLGTGQLTMRAMGLVYTTLLSIVPLLALSFSVLKAFGVHNQIEPALSRLLAPLGEQGAQITVRVIGFIENMNVGVLGSMGLALLFYTAVSLMQKIEEAFNYIWHVDQMRAVGERFSRYVSALLVGPVLVFAALGLTGTVLNSEVVRRLLELEALGQVIYFLGKLVPYLLVVGAFTFLYLFIPNTRVELGPALGAGVVGGALWQTAGWAFAAFVATSTRYSAIYSSFAVLILFMIWLYVAWLVLLIGASVGFYLQRPEYLVVTAGEPQLSNRLREQIALAAMAAIATRYGKALPPVTRLQLAKDLAVPGHTLDPVLQALECRGLVARTGDTPPAYLPARDLERLPVAELIQIVRAAGEDASLNPRMLPADPAVHAVLERIERSTAEALQDLTVAELARQLGRREPAPVLSRSTGHRR